MPKRMIWASNDWIMFLDSKIPLGYFIFHVQSVNARDQSTVRKKKHETVVIS